RHGATRGAARWTAGRLRADGVPPARVPAATSRSGVHARVDHRLGLGIRRGTRGGDRRPLRALPATEAGPGHHRDGARRRLPHRWLLMYTRARLRMTASFAVAFLVVLLLLGLGTYGGLVWALDREIDSGIEAVVDEWL